MKNVSYIVKDVPELRKHLMSSDIQTNVASSKAVLFQAFSSQTDMKKIRSITKVIKEAIPNAIVVGQLQ